MLVVAENRLGGEDFYKSIRRVRARFERRRCRRCGAVEDHVVGRAVCIRCREARPAHKHRAGKKRKGGKGGSRRGRHYRGRA